MAYVELTDLCKSFSENKQPEQGFLSVFKKKTAPVQPEATEAVSHFSLSVNKGEFVVLVGPSGCGKTTTLRMIAGLETPDCGEIRIDGTDVTGKDSGERDIAMVFQNYALYPHMSAYDNIASALWQRKIAKDEIDRLVRETAELLELTPYLKRKPAELSGGQRQRVAIGRAIVRRPKVMLMDEPLSNLDPALRTRMREELFRLRSQIDSTFIYVTHDQTEAMTLGDRIVIMDQGMIRQVGTPLEVLTRPVDIFTARFIGTPRMNLFNGELRFSAKELQIILHDRAFVIPAGTFPQAQPGPIRAGVRPEKIRLEDSGIEAIVSFIEMTGSVFHVHLRCGEEEVIAALPELPEGIARGDTVRFGFSPDALFLFDTESGRTL